MLGLAAGLVLVATAAGGFSPSPGSPVAVGDMPCAVATGDLNGDGKTDMVSANLGDNTISVLLGDGTGGFSEAAGSPLAAATAPISVALGDLNRDGKLDVAVALASSDVLSVRLGDGAGGFGSPTSYTVGSAPYDVAIGDLNGDGRPDLVSADYVGTGVSVLLGDGSGGFSTATGFPLGTIMTSVAIGDLNRDGHPDLVAGGFDSDSVSVLLGDGSGGFGGATTFAAGDPVNSVAIGDVNGDGRLDVATAHSGGTSVSILLGSGHGGLGAPTDFAVEPGPHTVALPDLNGDGDLDLATADAGSNDVSVLLGNGDGSFGPALSVPAGVRPYAVVAADLDGDGKPDLAVADNNASAIVVLLNTFVFPQTPPPAKTPTATALVADTEAPGAPGVLHGHFDRGSLLLDWQPASDNVAVDHYELRLDTTLPLLTIPAGTEQASTRAFHRSGRSVYAVTAIDAAGNHGSPSGTVTVVPNMRPAVAPRATPRWAWKLLAWQLRGRHTTRPATPHTLPAWYSAWKTWRLHPFRVAKRPG